MVRRGYVRITRIVGNTRGEKWEEYADVPKRDYNRNPAKAAVDDTQSPALLELISTRPSRHRKQEQSPSCPALPDAHHLLTGSTWKNACNTLFKEHVAPLLQNDPRGPTRSSCPQASTSPYSASILPKGASSPAAHPCNHRTPNPDIPGHHHSNSQTATAPRARFSASHPQDYHPIPCPIVAEKTYVLHSRLAPSMQSQAPPQIH